VVGKRPAIGPAAPRRHGRGRIAFGFGRVQTAPMARPREAERFLTTVLFTDIVGSTELAAELGDRGWRELVQMHHALVRSALRRHGGREIDTAGDGFFAVFDAPASGIACAAEIVAGVGELGLQVRAGLHVGEVEQIGGKVGGITVPIGARIAAAAAPGEVLVSATVRDLAAGAGLHFEDRGVHELKGVPGEWGLFAVARTTIHEAPATPTAGPDGATRRAAAVRRARSRPVWQRRPRLVAALIVGLALVVGTGGLIAWSPWRVPALASIAADSVGIIDIGRGEIVGQIPVGAQPGGMAVGEGSVWVTDSGTDKVSRIDPKTGSVVDSIDVGKVPTGVVVGAGSVWVADSGERSVTRINAATGRVVGTITVGIGPSAIAYGAGAVWVANTGDGTVMRIDPETGVPGPPIGVGSAPSAIASDDQGVWVASEDGGVVVHLDPRSGVTLAAPIPVGARPSAVAIGAGAVWVASRDGLLSRVDPVANRVSAIIDVGGSPAGLAATADALWIAGHDGAIRRADPATNMPGMPPIATGASPEAIVMVDGRVWFAARASAASHRGGTLRVVSLDAPVIDPTQFGSALLQVLTGDGLVGYRRVGGIAGSTLVPDLAASLPRPTDGGRTYTFQLRPGLVYADGQPVRPEDFRTAIERAFQVPAEFGGSSSGYFAAIEGADACADAPVPHCDLGAGIVGDAAAGTVSFHLSRPDPGFLSKLGVPGAFPVPAGSVPATEPSRTTYPATGPYMIASVSAQEIRLVRNPHFTSWDPDVRPDGYADEIVFTSGKTAKEQVAMLERGEADYMSDRIPPEMVAQLAARYTAQIHVADVRTTYFFMNTKLPPFDSLAVRQAVSLALDRANLQQLRGGPGANAVTCQVLPPNLPGYRPYCPYTRSPDAGGRWSAPDLPRAQALVDGSGTRGAKIVVGPLVPRLTAFGEVMTDVMKKLGYDASLEVATSGEDVYKAIFEDRRVQIGGFEIFADYPSPDSFLQGFTCAESDGLSNYCDPALDALVARARDLQATDPAAAADAWAAVDRMATDLALWAPVLNEGSDFVSARLGGYQFNPAWGILLDQAWVR
jgi:YVTN family beta-propeller protein